MGAVTRGQACVFRSVGARGAGADRVTPPAPGIHAVGAALRGGCVRGAGNLSALSLALGSKETTFLSALLFPTGT